MSNDNVNHPKHYTQGGIECIDALAAATVGLTGIEAVDTANAIKYLWRWKNKNGVEDIDKAIWYLNHLKKEVTKTSSGVEDIFQELEGTGVKFVKPSATLIVEENPVRKLEAIARTCYKSESNITEDSGKRLVRSLYVNRHMAMFEHVTFTFQVPAEVGETLFQDWEAVKYMHITEGIYSWIVTVNLRAILEQPICDEFLIAVCRAYPQFFEIFEVQDSGKQLNVELVTEQKNGFVVDDIFVDSRYKYHKYFTIRFITDRGVSHELVRHRNSFAQESTRYVNYDKRGMEFVLPCEFKEWPVEVKLRYLSSIRNCAEDYKALIRAGIKPQMARSVLPNSLKTEIVMTCNIARWLHFFDLRLKGTTGSPHPDMKVIANMAERVFTEYDSNWYTGSFYSNARAGFCD